MSINTLNENNNTVPLQRLPGLYLKLDTPKGRGVFSSSDIPTSTIIDTSPVLILDPSENATHIAHTTLYHYTYNWPAPRQFTPNQSTPRQSTPTRNQASSTNPLKTQALPLGLGALFNHSSQHQNVGWYRDLERQVIIYTALRDIAAGEELCISYGDRLTFVDADGANGEGVTGRESSDDEGDGVAVLGRIESNLE